MKQKYSRVSRLLGTCYSAKGNKREMDILVYKQPSKIVKRYLYVIPIYGNVSGRQIKALWAFVCVRVGVANFLGQSTDIDETNTFQLKF